MSLPVALAAWSPPSWSRHCYWIPPVRYTTSIRPVIPCKTLSPPALNLESHPNQFWSDIFGFSFLFFFKFFFLNNYIFNETNTHTHIYTEPELISGLLHSWDPSAPKRGYDSNYLQLPPCESYFPSWGSKHLSPTTHTLLHPQNVASSNLKCTSRKPELSRGRSRQGMEWVRHCTGSMPPLPLKKILKVPRMDFKHIKVLLGIWRLLSSGTKLPPVPPGSPFPIHTHQSWFLTHTPAPLEIGFSVVV